MCEIYNPLVRGREKRWNRYEVKNQSDIEIKLSRKEDGKEITFGRGIEILSKDSHVLILGTDANILGARPLEKVIYEAKEKGAVVVADHPCYTIKLGKGMGEERVRRFHEEGVLDSLEENGNITGLLEFIGHYNEKAVELARELDMPIIANCDGNTARDMGCMNTEYSIEGTTGHVFGEVLNIIKSSKFGDKRIVRKGTPKNFIALPLHVIRGFYSIYRADQGWIDRGLPAC